MKKNRHTMWFVLNKDVPPVAFKVPYRNAKSRVEMTRADVDIANGVPKKAGECANCQTGLRLREKFPHPVIFIEFTDARAYVVDKMKNGQPASCVVYKHNEKDFQKLFDSKNGRAKVRAAGYVGQTVTLSPLGPRKHSKVEPDGTEIHQPHTDTGNQKPEPVFRGSWARAKRSGLLKLSVV